MKKVVQRKSLAFKKVNIARINTKHLSNIKGGTRSTVNDVDGITNNEGDNTCRLF